MITTNYNYEIVNTSYIKNITDNINNQGQNGKNEVYNFNKQLGIKI